MDGQSITGFLPTNWKQINMGNMHHRVNMVLVTYLLIAISEHPTSSSDLYDLHPLEKSSNTQQKDGNEIVGSVNDNDHLHGRNIVKFPGKHLLEADEQEGNNTSTEVTSTWPSVLGALTAVLCVGLLSAVAVKYRLFRCCLARNSHALLLEGGMPVRGMRGRIMDASGDSSDDDDGFIEDNYIQANEREKPEQEENHQEDIQDSNDELVMPDII
ncbi:uncharacterized protein LOC127645369 isoform X1 [Xyrauchen texanus]|uniref:uncharacterized protein LOC127645369 isoform X1 n=1 Tax=Xyrauchen texanus TaxID=154827 RepID=UPI00224214CE|nr:uncharacterized protein LOC127645369 isoform X1 [Xyrauchen texanus]